MKNKKLWFRAKMFGWGWYPVSWEGWVVIALYVIAIFKNTWYLAPQHSVSDDLISVAIKVIPPTICLLIICYAKGERPRWRWGK
jgi:hypothetical protein